MNNTIKRFRELKPLDIDELNKQSQINRSSDMDYYEALLDMTADKLNEAIEHINNLSARVAGLEGQK